MVIALLTVLAAAAPDPPPIGVVRVARGQVSAESGALLAPASVVETGEDGWAELQVLGAGRVRLSASTRVSIAPESVVLESGRVWIQRSEALGRAHFDVALPRGRVAIGSGASVIVEHTQTGGSSVHVRAGNALIGEVVITPRRVVMIPAGAEHPAPPRPSGRGVEELVELEAEAALGDPAGMRAFLLDRSARSIVKRFRPRSVRELVRTEAEIAGGDVVSSALESAIKAPPFFEQEVPPKGPNVRVEVTFGED